MVVHCDLNRLFFSQLQLPEPLASQQLPGLQSAVDQLGARPPLHLWLQQQPVGAGPVPERAYEGHQGAEAPPTNWAQSQGPCQHSKCTQIRTSVCQTSPRWARCFCSYLPLTWPFSLFYFWLVMNFKQLPLSSGFGACFFSAYIKFTAMCNSILRYIHTRTDFYFILNVSSQQGVLSSVECRGVSWLQSGLVYLHNRGAGQHHLRIRPQKHCKIKQFYFIFSFKVPPLS